MAVTLEQMYEDLLKDKKIPYLVLDNKWHQLFTVEKKNRAIRKLENELNHLLQKQGKLNTDLKDLKKLKSNLLQEIRDNMTESSMDKKMEQNQKLVVEINEKIEQCEDELFELPKQMDAVNHQLMLETMSVFYNILKKNEDEITQIISWVNVIRQQVKDKMVTKTTLEEYNSTIYGYLHDVLGGDIINVFDFKYLNNSEENIP